MLWISIIIRRAARGCNPRIYSLDTRCIELSSPDASSSSGKLLAVAIRVRVRLENHSSSAPITQKHHRPSTQSKRKKTLTTVHPDPSFAYSEQFAKPVLPDCVTEDACMHPVFVCSAIWFAVIRFTPSMMSISPPLGQAASGPEVQKPGQT